MKDMTSSARNPELCDLPKVGLDTTNVGTDWQTPKSREPWVSGSFVNLNNYGAGPSRWNMLVFLLLQNMFFCPGKAQSNCNETFNPYSDGNEMYDPSNQ